MQKEKLHKFALNQLDNVSDIEEVVRWIEASKAHKEEFETLKNVLAMKDFANYETYAESEAEEIVEPHRERKFPMSLLKYAAVFMLAFFIGGLSIFFWGNSDELAFNEIIVPDGESAEVFLSDKTHVWLNSGTRLVYPAKFNGKIRNVELTGEAYFEVSHNPEIPFHVKTNHLTVEVLGTSFNVEAFDKTGEVNVTLVEGKVNLQNVEGQFLTKLLPGENARFATAQKKIYISNVDTKFFTSWKDGSLFFKDETLEAITRKFERWYNVKVVFEDEAIRKIHFTGTILKNKPIDQVFDILKYTAGIEYRIEMNNNQSSIIYLKNKPM
ncbi:FecR family protein [Geofilum sp. OHC36d9]|uniref:FecR family protein n=1 Tax=Geofilum sp. OHC36d9 TaxID=3458413 RepID=UPI0040339D84